MKILDIGQGLYVNPEYIVKIEREKKLIGEKISYTINIYLNYYFNNGKSLQIPNMEILSFDSQDKRDDYFLYLFNMLNESDNEVINKVSKKNDKKY